MHGLSVLKNSFISFCPWCSSPARDCRAIEARVGTDLRAVAGGCRDPDDSLVQLWARQTGLYTYIYYATVCRFDEFLPGIAIAMLKNFHRPTWQRMTRHGQLWLLTGTVAVATMLYCVDQFYRIDGYGYTFFMTAAGYSLNAMAFSLLVVAALSPNSWLARVRIPGAYQIALWSYSTYLSHKAVQIVLARQLRPFNLPPIALTCIIVVTAVLVGALLYWLVESPFMALRDRWFPSNLPPSPRQAHSLLHRHAEPAQDVESRARLEIPAVAVVNNDGSHVPAIQ